MYDLTAVNEATSHTTQALGHACIICHTHLRQEWPFQAACFSYEFSYEYLCMVTQRNCHVKPYKVCKIKLFMHTMDT